MNQETLAIFIDDNNNIDNKLIQNIFSNFANDYKDFVIIADSSTNISNIFAIIPSIYLKFFRGDVVFMSISSYLYNEDILANQIYVYASAHDLIENSVPKNRLNNVKILSIQNSSLEVFTYAKL
jgi:hypothetical protein